MHVLIIILALCCRLCQVIAKPAFIDCVGTLCRWLQVAGGRWVAGSGLEQQHKWEAETQQYHISSTWKDKIHGIWPSSDRSCYCYGLSMTVMCVSAFPHYFSYFSLISACLHSHSGLSMPHLACSMTCVTPICLGAMAMLPLAGFAHSHHSLAWSLTV